MTTSSPYRYKIADTQEELEKIYQLNYQTFVEEVRQHPGNPEGILIDRFNDENTYLICLKDDELIGMVAYRPKRPFSLDEKLGDVSKYFPDGARFTEIRLLAIVPRERLGRAFSGFLAHHVLWHDDVDIDYMLISAYTRQVKLYSRIGFKPFGPMVGTEDVKFQPMYLTRENLAKALKKISTFFGNEIADADLKGTPVKLSGK